MQQSAHLHGVLPIVKLVRDSVAASGLSLRAFAAERGIAYSTIRYYNNAKLAPISQPPRKDTLRELALALNVPLGDVEQAAVESLSYRTAAPQMERTPVRAPDLLDVTALSHSQRAAVKAVIRAMQETHHAATKTLPSPADAGGRGQLTPDDQIAAADQSRIARLKQEESLRRERPTNRPRPDLG